MRSGQSLDRATIRSIGKDLADLGTVKSPDPPRSVCNPNGGFKILTKGGESGKRVLGHEDKKCLLTSSIR